MKKYIFIYELTQDERDIILAYVNQLIACRPEPDVSQDSDATGFKDPMNVIEAAVHQAAIELGHTSGRNARDIMLKNGMTEEEAYEVLKKAFQFRWQDS